MVLICNSNINRQNVIFIQYFITKHKFLLKFLIIDLNFYHREICFDDRVALDKEI